MLCEYSFTPLVTVCFEGAASGQTGQGLEHFFQPFEFFLVFLWNLLSLEGFESLDLQRYFLRFGPCLSAPIGGSGKVSFNLIPIRGSQAWPWQSFMFPLVLCQTNISSIKTGPKLVHF